MNTPLATVFDLTDALDTPTREALTTVPGEDTAHLVVGPERGTTNAVRSLTRAIPVPRRGRRVDPTAARERRCLSSLSMSARYRPTASNRSTSMSDTRADSTHLAATYTRFRTGAWGVRVPDTVQPLSRGQTARVAVVKRSGEERREIVRCFWSGAPPSDGRRIALCEIVPSGDIPPGAAEPVP